MDDFVDIEGVEASLAALTSLPVEQSLATSEILFKLVSNIILQPNESKFRSIKKSNATINEKVLSIPAAHQILILSGFTEDDATLVCNEPGDSLKLTVTRDLLSTHISKEKVRLASSRQTDTDERLKALKAKREAEERAKKELLDQLERDRLEREARNRDRVPTASVAVKRDFGCKVAKFADIGVDVNKQGG